MKLIITALNEGGEESEPGVMMNEEDVKFWRVHKYFIVNEIREINSFIMYAMFAVENVFNNNNIRYINLYTMK